jgi:hypothetical protein
MNSNPAADTRSPWYETFAAAATMSTRWLEATRFPALAAEPQPEAAEQAMGGDEAPQATEEQWVTEALFDCYNA